MSIARRQLSKIMDSVIETFLKSGKIPLLKDINKKIQERLITHTLGMPFFKPILVKYGETSNSDNWNEMVERLDQDLNILYDESKDQVDRVLVDFDYMETERKKIDRELDRLQNRLKELLLLNNASDGYMYSYLDSFEDTTKTDLENTNCWMDLKLGEISTMLKKSENSKADMFGIVPEFKIAAPDLTVEPYKSNPPKQTEIQPISNMLDDNLDSAWIQNIDFPKEETVTYSITIPVLKENISSRLVIDPLTTEAIKLEAQIQYAGEWHSLDTKMTQKIVSWDFDPTNITSIRILLTKTKADSSKTTDGKQVTYSYQFGIKNVSLLLVAYEDYGTYQSIPFQILNRQDRPVQIDTIALEVDETIPTGSTLKYYVAWEEENPQWQPIASIGTVNSIAPTTINMKMINARSTGTLEASTATEHEQGQLFNGLKFYDVYNLGSETVVKNQNSVTIYKGIGQWKVDSFSEQGTPVAPELKRWYQKIPNLTSKYETIGTEIVLNSGTYTYTRYQTNVYVSDTSKTLTLKMHTGTTPELYASVYVNKVKAQISTSYGEGYISKSAGMANITTLNIALGSGWNEITILFYQHQAGPTTVSLGFDINSLSNSIRANIEPMQLVSEFDLLYNIKERDIDKFAIDDSNNIVIGEYLKNMGARFILEYKYYVEETISKRMIFKAEFNKGSATISPKLRYFKIKAG